MWVPSVVRQWAKRGDADRRVLRWLGAFASAAVAMDHRNEEPAARGGGGCWPGGAGGEGEGLSVEVTRLAPGPAELAHLG